MLREPLGDPSSGWSSSGTAPRTRAEGPASRRDPGVT